MTRFNNAQVRFDGAALQALKIFLLVLGLALSTSAHAAASKRPERDSAAIAVLQSSIAALGGSGAALAIQDCVVSGSTLSSSGLVTNFKWTIAGSEFRIETTTAKGGTNVFVSGHGSPSWTLNGKSTAINRHVARANLPLYLPLLVLFREAASVKFTIKNVGVVVVDGRNALQVHASDDSDRIGALVTFQDWDFDPISFLPLRVGFREPSSENAADYIQATFDFSEFKLFNGVLLPTAIVHLDDVSNETFRIQSVTFNSGVTPDLFDAPQGEKQ
jgi:hypothetical protein